MHCALGTIHQHGMQHQNIIFGHKSPTNSLTHYQKRVETRLLTFDKIDQDYYPLYYGPRPDPPTPGSGVSYFRVIRYRNTYNLHSRRRGGTRPYFYSMTKPAKIVTQFLPKCFRNKKNSRFAWNFERNWSFTLYLIQWQSSLAF